MDSLPVVVLVGHNTLVNGRIKNIFSNQNIKFYEAQNRRELLRVLSLNNKVDLILTEVEIDPQNGFNGFGLIQEVRAKRSGIPVVMLTSIGKREVITRCMREGATDYVLKPFKDEYMKERLLKYINIEKMTESTVLQFNLREFLEGEIHKACKGNYCFSLLKLQFDSNTGTEVAVPFYQYEEAIYSELKSLFWESDLYIRHGYQCHLGFFPFCDETNRQIVIDKIKSRFEGLKSRESNLSEYSITYTFTSYPSEGETALELLHNLSVNNIDLKTA